MLRALALPAILGLLLFAEAPAFADGVLLKNGRRIEGRVVRENDREVTIETQTGLLMSFERSKIDQIEREGKPNPSATPGTEKKSDDLAGLPDTLSDDEADRLRKVEAQVRDVGRRIRDAVQEKNDADKEATPAAQQQSRLADARAKELRSEIVKLKLIRDGILRSAQVRREQAEKRAAKEIENIHLDTEALRVRASSTALAEQAAKVKARVPQDPRDPTRKPFAAEAVRALVLAGEVDLDQARDQSSPEGKIQSLRGAAERFALAASWSERDDGAALRERAVQALSQAHKLSGLRPLEIEKSLLALGAFRACAVLVEDRLGERRWGAELLATEPGTFRTELGDGRAEYGDDLPTAADAKSVRERRERTERRVSKDDSGPTVTLVKVTRWYDLLWDPAKKKWVRESAASQLEGQQLAPLLRVYQEKADALAAAEADLDKASQALATKRAATLQVRWQVDAAEVGSDLLEKSLAEQRTAEKSVAAATAAMTAARAAMDERASELSSLDKDLERARKGS